MPKTKRVPQVERASPIPPVTLRLMNRMMRRAVGPIHKKLLQLEEKINSCSSNTSMTSNTSETEQVNRNADRVEMRTETLPIASNTPKICYVNVAQSINVEKPKFPGNKKIRPVTFIEDLTSWLKRTPVNDNEIDLIIECLEGEARDWARNHKDCWTSLEDFKRDFLETYWGEDEQSELRRKIAYNTWNKEIHPTMMGYFISLTAQAKMLSYPIPEKQLIGEIMRHFPREVQYSWANQTTMTIREATVFLRRLDNINIQKPTEPSSQPSTSGFQQRAPRYQGSFVSKGYQGSNSYNRQPNYTFKRQENVAAGRSDRNRKEAEINIIENSEELNNDNNDLNVVHNLN